MVARKLASQSPKEASAIAKSTKTNVVNTQVSFAGYCLLTKVGIRAKEKKAVPAAKTMSCQGIALSKTGRAGKEAQTKTARRSGPFQ